MSLSIRVRVSYLEVTHCFKHGVHGHENIPEHEILVLQTVLFRVAFPVDDPHLFDEGALS